MFVPISIISIIVVLVGVIVSLLTLAKNNTKDLKQETREQTILATKLEFIITGINTIQLKMSSQDSKFDNISERLTRVEESTKSTHKRIDLIEQKRECIK